MDMHHVMASAVVAIGLLWAGAATATELKVSPSEPSGGAAIPAQTGARSGAPAQDGLHSDHRWSAMERCINGTNQAEFNACLANAFLQDGTGASRYLGPPPH
jgi:hypothetical protein